ncbi:MAG TPA: hypothetical protein VE077_13255 [Candidatus Methylomirabilis sp.]|nr:hypothetical protein [Candidatus Methylomirabilis sp.]
MKNLKLALLVVSALSAACATSAAQQPKVFDWQTANDETVRMDPGNYYTGQTYHPGPNGGNIHLDIKAERPVTVFMTDAMSWELALQHPETIRDVRTSCTQEHVVEATYVCNLPGVAMTLVIRDERRNREGQAFAAFASVVRPEERTDRAVESGMEAAREGERFAERRFFEPNDVHIQYYRWDCVQNCIQPEFQWMEQVKEKYDLTSFLKVYGGFVADHDQTQVSIKVKAPVPMAVAMLPSNVANQLHAKPEALESALEKSPCQQRGVEKTDFQCTFNVSDGPQSLIVVPEDTSNIPRKKKSEIEMQFVKCVANCQLIETSQKSAATGTPNQN